MLIFELRRGSRMMQGNNDLYELFVSKDPSFDGRFFVGISSTGIYCRPICKAKKPKAENCSFYRTAAEAEQAGYRPCLMCRPELAPGISVAEVFANPIRRAARIIEEDHRSGYSVDDIARRIGCTSRHLRRIFADEYNVTPIQYIQTCRLLLAKGLLTDTDLPVSDVAKASGFGSSRRFNDLFQKQYRLSPTALRKQTKEKKVDHITVMLGYRPPYRWDEMLKFLSSRAVIGTEVVKDSEYARTVRMITADGEHVYGWLRVGNNKKRNALTVTVSRSLICVLPKVLARVRRMFDLNCDPSLVYRELKKMNDLRSGLCSPGIRLPGCFDAFELSVRAVLGQQITVKAASTLASRIAQTYGMPIDTGIEGLSYIFPSPWDIVSFDEPVEDNLGSLGVVAARSRTIRDLANAFIENEIDLDLPARPEEEIEKLTSICGIGNWTAQYIAMRTIGWNDAFLETDAGIKKALPNKSSKELLQLAEAWRPWRSYAVINIWNTL